jgi:hypothetical protein
MDNLEGCITFGNPTHHEWHKGTPFGHGRFPDIDYPFRLGNGKVVCLMCAEEFVQLIIYYNKQYAFDHDHIVILREIAAKACNAMLELEGVYWYCQVQKRILSLICRYF